MSGIWVRMDGAGILPLEMKTYPVEGWLELPPGLSMEAAAVMMLCDGQWCPRPCIAAPSQEQVTEGLVVGFQDLPEGAVCEIFDRAFQEVLDRVPARKGCITFMIADPGTYQLDLTAPAPWIGLTLNVEVK